MEILKKDYGKIGITVSDKPYSIDNSYERLTIVETENGLTYLSKKDVPAALQIDINNKEYWIKLTGTGDIPIEEIVDLIKPYTSSIHKGEFNAGNITEEGWYDSITFGRPEDSESDEKYFLYMSSNGGQVCFSRRNSGKVYHRLGKEHPWVSVSHDDYVLKQIYSSALGNYSTFNTLSVETMMGFSDYSRQEDLGEVYAGDNLDITDIDIVSPIHLKPNAILKVRCLYRWGDSSQGTSVHAQNSDAYIYISNAREAGHDSAHLLSDFIKVRPMAEYIPLMSDEEKGWQDLSLVRKTLFKNEYGVHYVKCNVLKEGNYFFHIAGNFSLAKSWLVVDNVEIYNQSHGVIIPTATATTIGGIKLRTQESGGEIKNRSGLNLENGALLVHCPVPSTQIPSDTNALAYLYIDDDGILRINRATASDINSNATDDKLVTAKCLYDVISDIETRLSAL